jgi:hypothetical protein
VKLNLSPLGNRNIQHTVIYPAANPAGVKPKTYHFLWKGIYSVISDEEGGCAIKRVFQNDHHWVLISDNPEYTPITLEKARIPNIVIGRVIWS